MLSKPVIDYKKEYYLSWIDDQDVRRDVNSLISLMVFSAYLAVSWSLRPFPNLDFLPFPSRLVCATATYNSKTGGGGSSGPIRGTDYTCSIEVLSNVLAILTKKSMLSIDRTSCVSYHQLRDYLTDQDR